MPKPAISYHTEPVAPATGFFVEKMQRQGNKSIIHGIVFVV